MSLNSVSSRKHIGLEVCWHRRKANARLMLHSTGEKRADVRLAAAPWAELAKQSVPRGPRSSSDSGGIAELSFSALHDTQQCFRCIRLCFFISFGLKESYWFSQSVKKKKKVLRGFLFPTVLQISDFPPNDKILHLAPNEQWICVSSFVSPLLPLLSALCKPDQAT